MSMFKSFVVALTTASTYIAYMRFSTKTISAILVGWLLVMSSSTLEALAVLSWSMCSMTWCKENGGCGGNQIMKDHHFFPLGQKRDLHTGNIKFKLTRLDQSFDTPIKCSYKLQLGYKEAR
ncbi:hypothetical protein TorRG33x02_125620 [Trema orientale]|uniref:Uncharacterized protein n=1 Tax=Trema orientale TaxID=63057 RepID=A0A2P5F1S0_TREOI|nr:hypothetical protein TorRG33x02_125620 [Trema orientale]